MSDKLNDFEEIYAIDSRVYRDEEVTAEERAKVRSFILDVFGAAEDYPLGVRLWAIYSAKDYPDEN